MRVGIPVVTIDSVITLVRMYKVRPRLAAATIGRMAKMADIRSGPGLAGAVR